VHSPRMSAIRTHDLARFFKALGDENRLCLVTPRIIRSFRESCSCPGRRKPAVPGNPIHYFLDQDRLGVYQGLARELLGTALFVETDREGDESDV